MKSLLTILTGPEKWTKGAFGRTAAGDNTSPAHAVSFCLEGLCDRSVLDGLLSVTEFDAIDQKLREAVHRRTGYTSLIYFNDSPSTKFEDIVAVIREAEAALGVESAQ